MSALLEQFLTVFEAVAQIGLVVLFASWLVRRNVIAKSGVKLISDTVITVFLPCMIFSNALLNVTNRYPSFSGRTSTNRAGGSSACSSSMTLIPTLPLLLLGVILYSS